MATAQQATAASRDAQDAAEVQRLEGESERLARAVLRAQLQGVTPTPALTVTMRALEGLLRLLVEAEAVTALGAARLINTFWRQEFERAKHEIGQRDPGFGSELAQEVAAPVKTAGCQWKDCGQKADTVIAGKEYCSAHLPQARASVAR